MRKHVFLIILLLLAETVFAQNILVIERSGPVLKNLKKSLYRAGYWVYTTRKWGKALKILKYERIKLVVMPHYLETGLYGMLGFEAVEHIRNVLKSDVKIIYIAPELENRQRGIRTGADDHITNPLDSSLLIRKIKLLLKPR